MEYNEWAYIFIPFEFSDSNYIYIIIFGLKKMPQNLSLLILSAWKTTNWCIEENVFIYELSYIYNNLLTIIN